MKKLKLMMFLSVLNIGMFHFNINWVDLFKPINAYENTGSLVGDILGRVIVDQVGDKLADAISKRSLSLKNKQTGEVITFSPGTKVRINLEDTDYTFKRYKGEENTIYLKAGSLDFTYDFSTLDYISVVLEPPAESVTLASALGGTAGLLLGAAAEAASNPKYMSTGGGAMMGCTLGMAVGPTVYVKNFHESETIDFSLTDWEVH